MSKNRSEFERACKIYGLYEHKFDRFFYSFNPFLIIKGHFKDRYAKINAWLTKLFLKTFCVFTTTAKLEKIIERLRLVLYNYGFYTRK
ncbi:hypothetical protein BpHYR1_032999 [Brachionus plicatilis]|uniref:Uncharacterized protein n=1 Tax=Brachionus plicatilis TaxID=10195 RepID=A0A3M7R8T7_BRAPC|nr:hypothetical protein BpHYR1_032999 [Brachionus plicatilis]